MLGFLLAAEVIAAAAVVSEAALIYVARTRNMVISLIMLALEAGLAAALILVMRAQGLPLAFQATGPAIALVRGARLSPRSPSRGCWRRSSARAVSGWRWDLAWATAAGRRRRRGGRATACRETLQLIIGVPAILVAFGAVLWTKGFGARGPRAVPHAQGRSAGTARGRGRAPRPATRSRTTSSSVASGGSGACR